MKKFFTLCLLGVTMCVVAQENNQQATRIKLPQWFVNIPSNAYVGISEPNGCENQAIAMAIIQYMFANNLSGNGRVNWMSKSSNDTYLLEIYRSAQFSADLSFDVTETKRLASGEYVCCITPGTTHSIQCRVRYQQMVKSENNSDVQNFTFNMQSMEWQWFISSDIINDSIQYGSQFSDATILKEFYNTTEKKPYIYEASQASPSISQGITVSLTDHSLCRALLNTYSDLLNNHCTWNSPQEQSDSIQLHGRVCSIPITTKGATQSLSIYYY
ncbi:MAG: hypothetical protein KBT27_11530 [Prevotellaceae bacterium]|nr:hypothetical protein [Candidatus Faecinaster equi]